ncbi:DUF2637 domain-containing protein [Embleya sp. NPDC005971]|uniref:DUF2637 domain-containing protein n=1 Tax=Embleya sp. NPDC005971 TaxID=3156724 RepID=UPI003403D959
MSQEQDPSHTDGAGATRAGRWRHGQWLPVAAACAADAFLGFLAFRLSFAALTAIATEHGVGADIAWMFAVMVDGGAMTGTVGVVMAKRSGRAVGPYWCVVAGSAGVSLAFNVAHSDGTGLGVAIAVTPPLAQLVATELLVRLLPEPDAVPTGAQLASVERAVALAVGAADRARESLALVERAREAVGVDVKAVAKEAAGVAALEVGAVVERAERAADTALGAAERAAQVVASAHAEAADVLDRVGTAAKHVARDATVVAQAREGVAVEAAEVARCAREVGGHVARAEHLADGAVAAVAEAAEVAARDATVVARRAADAAAGAVDRVSGHLVDVGAAKRLEVEERAAAAREVERLVAAALSHARTAEAAAEVAAEAATRPAADAGPYPVGTPERVVYDLWSAGGRWPEESEIQVALRAVGLGASRQQAQKKRTLVGRDFPKLPRKREQLELAGAGR